MRYVILAFKVSFMNAVLLDTYTYQEAEAFAKLNNIVLPLL